MSCTHLSDNTLFSTNFKKLQHTEWPVKLAANRNLTGDPLRYHIGKYHILETLASKHDF
jgi:hypothetical protein